MHWSRARRSVEAAGLTAEQSAALHAVTFTFTDMTGLCLGSATPGQVNIDTDAAGWFVDATPGDSSIASTGW